MDRKSLQRFDEKVDRAGPVPEHRPELGACWLWTASTREGYGQFSLRRKTLSAHRVAWEHERGDVPPGMLVLHRCDNPRCVRADHLFVGTDADNARDRDTKGRGVMPDNSGEANGHARLDKDQVAEVRRRSADGERQRLIARRFGISRRHVNSIVNRERWGSVS